MIPALLAFLLAFGTPAQAATVFFCANYKVDYSNNTAHDEYFTNDDDQPARGARIKVTENGGSVVSDAYSDDGGCSAGLTLDPLKSYTVQIVSDAKLHTNYVQVKDPTGTYFIASTALSSYTPPSTGDIKPIYTNVNPTWNVAAVAGWAAYDQWGGLTNQTFRFRVVSAGNDMQQNGGNPYSTIHDYEDTYVVIHEMGHQVSFLANNAVLGTNSMDYGASANGCPALVGGHDLNSKEFQKAAFMEGFASFYAELVFNDDTLNSDCYYHHGGEDWNLDNVVDSLDAQDPSCELGPYPYPGATTPINEYDYLGDYCLFSGASNNRGTQYDWMRFLWDLHTDGGWGSPPPLATSLAVIDASTPQTWHQTGVADNLTAGSPAYELRQAAISQGILTFWDGNDDLNGVQR